MPLSIKVPHRQLGQGERLWARVSEAGSTNGSMVVQLSGMVDADRMHRAAKQVSRIHPMLRARLADGPDRDTLIVPDTARVPWRVLARQGDQHWQTLVESELAEGIKPSDRPLWRLCLLQGLQASELVLTMHHAVSDGASGYLLMGHILQAYAGQEPLPDPQPLPPAYDALLGKPLDWRQWLFNAQALWRMATRPQPANWSVGTTAPLSACHTRILTAQLDAVTHAALLRQCQARGKTINGLISAAFMQATAEVMGIQAPQWLSMTSAVSVRHLVPRALSRTVAYLVGSCEVTCQTSPDGDPWALAEQVTGQTMRQMRARPIVLGLWLRRCLLAVKPEGHQLVAAAPKTSRAHIHLTNMGKVKMKRDVDDLYLRRCFHVSSVHLAQRPFVNLAAVTLDGDVQMTFSYCAPLTPPQQVERLSQSLLRRLCDVARMDQALARGAA